MDDVSVFLFGSAARGDPDEASDIDVIAIYGSEVNAARRNQLQSALGLRFGERLALAEYSLKRIHEMFNEGHLFAWHLFREAKRLAITDFGASATYFFPKPSPYASGREDALRFIALLRSCYRHLIEGGASSEVYEAGLVYLALRNIAMSLSSSCFAQPDFTRYSPDHLSSVLGIPPPCSRLVYDTLISARHSSQRGLAAPVIGLEDLQATVKQCLSWAELVLEEVDGKC